MALHYYYKEKGLLILLLKVCENAMCPIIQLTQLPETYLKYGAWAGCVVAEEFTFGGKDLSGPIWSGPRL